VTPFQARLLRDLADGGTLANYYRHFILWRRHGSKDPRSTRVPNKTATALKAMGFVEEVPGSRFPDGNLGISEAGRKAIANLPASAFDSKPRPKPAVNARDILALLHRRHRAPRFFIGDEFTIGQTVADAVAIGLNRPYMTIAYEIKVSRSDFKREIANPRKNRDLFEMVDEFYYVCPATLIDKKEVPPPAGLIYAWPSGLRTARRFDRTVFNLPRLVSRELTAALLRRSGRSDRQAVRTAYLLATMVERIRAMPGAQTADYWRGEMVDELLRDAWRLKDEAVRAGIIGDDLRT
jgi:hypothetical protein